VKRKSIPARPKAAIHPAAESADTDLIRLTREFESLKAQQERINSARKESLDSQQAAGIQYRMAITRHDGILEQLNRQERTLDAQRQNVTELLAKHFGARHETCGANSTR